MSAGHSSVACCHEGCSELVWMTDAQIERRKRTHEWWYCANGHHQHWPQATAEEKRIAELERQLAAAERDKVWLRRARDAALTACPWSGCGYYANTERGRHLHLVRVHRMPPLYLVRAESEEASA